MCNAGIAAPSFTTRSLGTKLVLYPQIIASSCDYAIGVENHNLWYSTPTTANIHRFYCGVSQVLDVSINSSTAPGRIYNYQTTQTILQTAGSTALTLAHLLNGIYQITQTAAVMLPLPTGTLTYAGGFGIHQSVDWTVINTGSSLGAVAVQANTAHTLIGSGAVAIGTSGRFRTRITVINIAITYRIS